MSLRFQRLFQLAALLAAFGTVSSAGAAPRECKRALSRGGKTKPDRKIVSGGEAAITRLSQDPELKELFQKWPGVRDHNTLLEHVREVYGALAELWPAFSKNVEPRDEKRLLEVLTYTMALHDIGKPLAAEARELEKQHEYTVPILKSTLRRLKFSEDEIALSVALVDNDVIGELIQEKIGLEEALTKLLAVASTTRLSPSEFFRLQTLFYSADAGSYQTLRYSDVFTEIDGKIALRHPRFLMLQSLFSFVGQGRKIRFADKSVGRSGNVMAAQELSWALAPFFDGGLDLNGYRADAETLAAFRKKYPEFDKYKKYGFAPDYKQAFGNRPNTAGITAEEMYIVDSYKSGKEGNYDWVRALYAADVAGVSENELEIKILASFLNKLRGFTGTVYRFATLDEELLTRYVPGQVVVEPSFISTSAVERDASREYSNTYFDIRLRGRSGHDIDFAKDAEAEVLINANTAFRVVKVERRSRPGSSLSKTYTNIVLEEVLDSELKELSLVEGRAVARPRPARAPVVEEIEHPKGAMLQSIYRNGKTIFYFFPDGTVSVNGSKKLYNVRGDEVTIKMSKTETAVFKRRKDGTLTRSDGLVFTIE